MQLTVNSDVFKDALAFTVKMLPANTTQPILAGVLLEAAENKLTLSTFNYEISAKTTVTAAVDIEGTVLLPGKLVNNIVSKLSSADILISLEDNVVLLKCGSSKFQLPSMPVAEFPQLPSVTTIAGVVPADKFMQAINQISMAASKDDVTPVLTSVNLSTADSHLMLTATDRYRIARRGIEWENKAEKDINVLIPANFLSNVGKTFNDAKIVELAVSDEEGREIIGFIANERIVTAQLLKGNYPPLERLFAKEKDHYCVINTEDLISALNRISAVIEQNDSVKFTFNEGLVTLEAKGSETAKANEKVECHLNGEEISISLRARFVIDGLRETNSEFTRICFSDGSNDRPGAVLFKGQTSDTGVDEFAFKYLLQPTLLQR